MVRHWPASPACGGGNEKPPCTSMYAELVVAKAELSELQLDNQRCVDVDSQLAAVARRRANMKRVQADQCEEYEKELQECERQLQTLRAAKLVEDLELTSLLSAEAAQAERRLRRKTWSADECLTKAHRRLMGHSLLKVLAENVGCLDQSRSCVTWPELPNMADRIVTLAECESMHALSSKRTDAVQIAESAVQDAIQSLKSKSLPSTAHAALSSDGGEVESSGSDAIERSGQLARTAQSAILSSSASGPSILLEAANAPGGPSSYALPRDRRDLEADFTDGSLPVELESVPLGVSLARAATEDRVEIRSCLRRFRSKIAMDLDALSARRRDTHVRTAEAYDVLAVQLSKLSKALVAADAFKEEFPKSRLVPVQSSPKRKSAVRCGGARKSVETVPAAKPNGLAALVIKQVGSETISTAGGQGKATGQACSGNSQLNSERRVSEACASSLSTDGSREDDCPTPRTVDGNPVSSTHGADASQLRSLMLNQWTSHQELQASAEEELRRCWPVMERRARHRLAFSRSVVAGLRETLAAAHTDGGAVSSKPPASSRHAKAMTVESSSSPSSMKAKRQQLQLGRKAARMFATAESEAEQALGAVRELAGHALDAEAWLRQVAEDGLEDEDEEWENAPRISEGVLELLHRIRLSMDSILESTAS